ncbi:MAG: MotA/TolQ/ExbB proton channel family protein, partial [Xenophilus sp.]
MSALELLTRGDALSRGVAALLLAMSIASWVVILWKGWLLRGGTRDVARSTAAFWQARTLDDARQRVAAFDRAGLVGPSVAALHQAAADTQAAQGTLAARSALPQR